MHLYASKLHYLSAGGLIYMYIVSNSSSKGLQNGWTSDSGSGWSCPVGEAAWVEGACSVWKESDVVMKCNQRLSAYLVWHRKVAQWTPNCLTAVLSPTPNVGLSQCCSKFWARLRLYLEIRLDLTEALKGSYGKYAVVLRNNQKRYSYFRTCIFPKFLCLLFSPVFRALYETCPKAVAQAERKLVTALSNPFLCPQSILTTFVSLYLKAKVL